MSLSLLRYLNFFKAKRHGVLKEDQTSQTWPIWWKYNLTHRIRELNERRTRAEIYKENK